MFGSIWNFVKRHKKKFVVTGIVIGGIYYCGRYAKKKLQEYQEREGIEFLIYARKQLHYLNTQTTCNGTIISLISNLKETLQYKIDTESLLAELKDRPNNKLELWEKLKILSFTKIFVTLYASCILVLSLKVQMNILGGRMFQKAAENIRMSLGENLSGIGTSPATQTNYLAKMKLFFDENVDDIISCVKSAVIETIAEMNLRDPVSLLTFQKIVGCIRTKVEVKQQNGYHDFIPFSLAQFMRFLEPQACDLCTSDIKDFTTSSTYEKTMEILGGSDFQITSDVCLDLSFSYLIKEFEELLDSGSSNPNNGIQSKPLAKVIPILNGMVLSLLCDHCNQLFTDLVENTHVNSLASNVYNICSEGVTK